MRSSTKSTNFIIFSYDGEFINGYHLDKEINKFAINEDNGISTQLNSGTGINDVIGVFHRCRFLFSEIPLDSVINDPANTPEKTYSGFDFNQRIPEVYEFVLQ